MGEMQRRQAVGNYPLSNSKAGQQIQVDLKNAKQKECECGNKYFNQVVGVFIVSALVSPTGQELVVQRPELVCSECKKEIKFIDLEKKP